MSLSYKTLSFKAAGEDLAVGQFAGYASTFLGPVDSYGHIIDPKAFNGSLDFFLESGLILKEHSTRLAIGKPLEARVDKTGLYIKGQISDTTNGRDALTLVRDGVIRKMSIGFMTEGYEVLSKERGIELLGEEAYNAALKELPWYYDGLTLLTQIKLYEVSLVAFPANEAATITGVKSSLTQLAAKITTERQFEEFLRDAGFSVREAKTLTNHGYKALRDVEAPTTATPADNSDELALSLKQLTASLKG